jgi:hypothetical protein
MRDSEVFSELFTYGSPWLMDHPACWVFVALKWNCYQPYWRAYLLLNALYVACFTDYLFRVYGNQESVIDATGGIEDAHDQKIMPCLFALIMVQQECNDFEEYEFAGMLYKEICKRNFIKWQERHVYKLFWVLLSLYLLVIVVELFQV